MVQKLKSTIYPSWMQSARARHDCTQWIDDSLSENIDVIAQILAPPTFEILLQSLVTFWFFTPMLPDKWVIVRLFYSNCFWNVVFFTNIFTVKKWWIQMTKKRTVLIMFLFPFLDFHNAFFMILFAKAENWNEPRQFQSKVKLKPTLVVICFCKKQIQPAELFCRSFVEFKNCRRVFSHFCRNKNVVLTLSL